MYVYTLTCVYTCINTPGLRPLSIILLSRLCCCTLRLSRPQAHPGFYRSLTSVSFTPEKPQTHQSVKNAWERDKRAPSPVWSGFRRGTLPPPGSDGAGRDGTGRARLGARWRDATGRGWPRSCSFVTARHFSDQAAAEPCGAQRALLRVLPLGRACSLPGQPQYFSFLLSRKRLFEHSFPRSRGSSRRAPGCRELAGRSRSWRPAWLAGQRQQGGSVAGAVLTVLAIKSRGWG